MRASGNIWNNSKVLMVDLLIVHPILDFALYLACHSAVAVALRAILIEQSVKAVCGAADHYPAFAATARALNIHDHISSPGCHVLSDVRG
jgi:hypothetical protein